MSGNQFQKAGGKTLVGCPKNRREELAQQTAREKIGYLCIRIPPLGGRLNWTPPRNSGPQPLSSQFFMRQVAIVISELGATARADVVIARRELQAVPADWTQVPVHRFAHSSLKYSRFDPSRWQRRSSTILARAPTGNEAHGIGLYRVGNTLVTRIAPKKLVWSSKRSMSASFRRWHSSTEAGFGPPRKTSASDSYSSAVATPN